MMTADRFNLILDKYRDVVGTDSARARKIIMKLNYRNNFYLLHCIAQTYLDESRFEDGTTKCGGRLISENGEWPRST